MSAPAGVSLPPTGPETRVVAVVLNWNGGDETLSSLRSLRETRGVRPVPLLADNGSTDGSVERALAEDPTLRVLRLGSNLGYAGGNNHALRVALAEMGADWVCLLNSDLEVAPDTFTQLLAGVRQAQEQGRAVGLAGPCLLYKDRPNVVWACGGRIGPSLNVTQLADHNGAPRDGEPSDVDYVPGACLLVSRQACERAGLLDEAYFCYLEDADWGVRVRKAGLRALAVPRARAFHALSTSTGGGYTAGRKYMTAVNSVRFLRQHGNFAGWVALFVFDVLLWPLAWLRAATQGGAAGAVAKLRGVFDGLRGTQIDAEVAARFARRPS